MTEETQLVIMLRNDASGFLEKEYAAIPLAEVGEFEPLLVNVFAAQRDGGTYIHMKLSTGQDVSDWQYNAVYDYYDAEVFTGVVMSVGEVDDVFNPTWELVFEAGSDGAAELAAKVRDLLEIHSRELADTFEAIAEVESEYTNEQ
ncbi:MAG: hypothetical protein FWE20_10870 [Defluviitaleaceae bacterium]|nr:hypothetical protein [Defluviitaleaceae bacterium]